MNEREILKQLQSQVNALTQAVVDAQFWHDRRLEQAQADYQRHVGEMTAHYEQAVDCARAAYREVLAQAAEESASLTQAAGLIAAPWEDPSWQAWTLATASPLPGCTRLGQLVAGREPDALVLPAMLPVIGGRSLLLKATGPAKALAVQAIQSLLLRLLATMPPGKLGLTCVDPVGLGHNVAPFMHLADYEESLVNGKAWTEPQHIEQRLADLTTHMENVIQKYLRNQFATIEEYNAQAEVVEPYRLLVVLDFPVNFSEAAARRLVSVVQNGPRCGVYTVGLVDTAKPLPYGFQLSELEQAATVVAWEEARFVWQEEDFQDCRLEPDRPPEADLFNRILTTVGQAAKAASRIEVPFERIAPPASQWWEGKSRSGLQAPLGPAGARKVQSLELGQGTAQHVLVAGKTGSGKSTLLHVLITSLALTYSPQEVALYLIDFKKGVEFKPYAVHHLPHAQVIAIESEREFGLSVLQGLDAELKRRGDRFRAAGVDGLADYRRKSGQGMPRLLLLVDEFQEFFTEDDAIASQAAQILDRLVRQGRAFGIHLVLGSQTLAGAYSLARSTIDQMTVRIALQCSEADSRLILADDNPAARLLSHPGEAIYNASNGMVEGNTHFQVAWLPDEQRDHYLQRLQERGDRPRQPQIVFEGNAPGAVEKNPWLQDLLATPHVRMPTEGAAPAKALAWLGEPMAMREPVAALFHRQSGSNLLLVGQNDALALGMVAAALISLMAQTAPRRSGNGAVNPHRIWVLDFSPPDGPQANFLERLNSQGAAAMTLGRRRQMGERIAELAAEVQRRLERENAGDRPQFLVVYGVQRARDLRLEEGLSFSSLSSEPAPPSSSEQFLKILRDGPEVGVHTVVWCDTVTNLNRVLDRRGVREFALRVVLQMSAEDSANLVDTPAASKLGAHRALFYSEEEGRLEKFRPYGLPSESWLTWVGEQLRAHYQGEQLG